MPEPHGLVVAEAMAAGQPVIATTPGGPAEMITDRACGLLVACGDATLDTARRRASTPTTATATARRWLRTIAARTPQPTFTDPEAR